MKVTVHASPWKDGDPEQVVMTFDDGRCPVNVTRRQAQSGELPNGITLFRAGNDHTHLVYPYPAPAALPLSAPDLNRAQRRAMARGKPRR